MCDECGGEGYLSVSFGTGDMYERYCSECGALNGGAMIGGSSPYKTPKDAEEKDWDRSCLECKAPNTMKYRKVVLD